MIAYTDTLPCLENKRLYHRLRARSLFDQHPGSSYALRAEGAQEARDDLVHQLEVGRQRRRVVVLVVEPFFAQCFRINLRARAAVNEDEFLLQDEALALHV